MRTVDEMSRKSRTIVSKLQSLLSNRGLVHPNDYLKNSYHQYISSLLRYRHSDGSVRKWLACPDTSLRPEFGCPEVWAKEIHQWNCKYAWNGVNEGEALDEQYWKRIERDLVFEELIMMASVRLAAVLNAVTRYRDEVGLLP